MSVFELDIFYRALAAGLLIAVLAGTLGVPVVLRRMSFFSDAIAHASLTGIAFSLLWNIEPLWGAIGFSVLIGLGIAALNRRSILGLDTIIGVFYSAAVALGVIIISSLEGVRVDLVGFLFGDILGIDSQDLLLALILSVVALAVLALMFRGLIQLALSRDLAKVNRVKVNLIETVFMVLLALTVAVGIKLVGIVLIGPLLIIPAAAAKNLSRSLTQMIVFSIIAAVIGVVIGMFGSAWLATPTGPTIVMAMAILFAITLLVRPYRT
jgi:zinc transport system permease protein